MWLRGPVAGSVPQRNTIHTHGSYFNCFLHFYEHIVKRTIFPHKLVAISVAHGKAFLTETYNATRVQCTVALEAIPGRACLHGPTADSVLNYTCGHTFPPPHMYKKQCTRHFLGQVLSFWIISLSSSSSSFNECSIRHTSFLAWAGSS